MSRSNIFHYSGCYWICAGRDAVFKICRALTSFLLFFPAEERQAECDFINSDSQVMFMPPFFSPLIPRSKSLTLVFTVFTLVLDHRCLITHQLLLRLDEQGCEDLQDPLRRKSMRKRTWCEEQFLGCVFQGFLLYAACSCAFTPPTFPFSFIRLLVQSCWDVEGFLCGTAGWGITKPLKTFVLSSREQRSNKQTGMPFFFNLNSYSSYFNEMSICMYYECIDAYKAWWWVQGAWWSGLCG